MLVSVLLSYVEAAVLLKRQLREMFGTNGRLWMGGGIIEHILVWVRVVVVMNLYALLLWIRGNAYMDSCRWLHGIVSWMIWIRGITDMHSWKWRRGVV